MIRNAMNGDNQLCESHITIVGCGFSGICAGVKLLSIGYSNFTIFEKAPSIGGTWFENTYPGCGCDVPSMLYSFSFDLYPEWDYFWAKQGQILDYMKYVVDKRGLANHIVLGTKVTNALWDGHDSSWRITLESADCETVVVSSYLILGHG